MDQATGVGEALRETLTSLPGVVSVQGRGPGSAWCWTDPPSCSTSTHGSRLFGGHGG